MLQDPNTHTMTALVQDPDGYVGLSVFDLSTETGWKYAGHVAALTNWTHQAAMQEWAVDAANYALRTNLEWVRPALRGIEHDTI